MVDKYDGGEGPSRSRRRDGDGAMSRCDAIQRDIDVLTDVTIRCSETRRRLSDVF